MSFTRRSFVAGAAAAPVALSAASEALAEEAKVLSSEDVIEFLYVDSATLAAGTEQHIALGLAADADGISAAELALSDEAGALTTLRLTNSSDSAVLFSFTPEAEGEYALSSLSYTAGGTSAVVDFSDCTSPCRTFTVASASAADEGVLTSVTTFAESEDAAPQTVSADEEELLSDEYAVSALSSSTGTLMVALNPGHGGYDSGAADNGAKEADLTWQIYQYCRAELELYSGVSVFLHPHPGRVPEPPGARRARPGRRLRRLREPPHQCVGRLGRRGLLPVRLQLQQLRLHHGQGARGHDPRGAQ